MDDRCLIIFVMCNIKKKKFSSERNATLKIFSVHDQSKCPGILPCCTGCLKGIHLVIPTTLMGIFLLFAFQYDEPPN